MISGDWGYLPEWKSAHIVFFLWFCDCRYTENPDSEGRPDQVVAEIWWQNLLRRDFSIIAALFMGQVGYLCKFFFRWRVDWLPVTL